MRPFGVFKGPLTSAVGLRTAGYFAARLIDAAPNCAAGFNLTGGLPELRVLIVHPSCRVYKGRRILRGLETALSSLFRKTLVSPFTRGAFFCILSDGITGFVN